MRIRTIFGLLAAGILFVYCGGDKGVESTPKSKIEGSVTFTGAWPEAAEEVRVVVGTEFPITSFDDLNQSAPINSDGSVSYSIEVDNGTYAFVGVAWRPAGGSWGLAGVCGVYTADANFLTPAKVTVSADSPTASGINISVNRSNAKKLTGSQVVGTIQLQGAWPTEYSSAVMITSSKDLVSEPFSLLDLNLGTAIERGATEADYMVDTPAGSIQTIGVAFLDANGRLSQDAVYFAQNNGGLVINEQTIGDNQTVTGPDFAVKLGSVTSGIKGTVSFVGDWPAKVEEVRLITAKVFPPAMDELIIGEEISADAVNHKYTFYLEPGTYKVMGVVWRAEGTEWDLMSICGAYFAGEDSLAPSEVIVPHGESFVEDINIVVDRSKARKVTETYIQGNITFNGTWPQGFSEARVITTTRFQIFPPILPTMLDLAFSDPIPVGTESASYSMRAFPGTFAAIGVIFLKGEEEMTIDDILYSLDVGGLELTPFDVAENTTVSDKNFNIVFP